MSKNHVAAPSTRIASSVATLALALVVALEMGGVYALSQGPSASVAVATDDGAAAAYAPAKPRVASVEISIVAQADTPAR
jgi:hypothetical protein